MGGKLSTPAVYIAASPACVFELIMNLADYPNWGMPFTIQMDLQNVTDRHQKLLLQRGDVIIEHVVLNPNIPTSVRLQRVVVTEILSQPESGIFRVCWESVMVFKWILHAVRVQEVRSRGGGGCVYETSDTMTGLLVPLVFLLYGSAVTRGFAAQGIALKERAEK
jgi:hypothetical protein